MKYSSKLNSDIQILSELITKELKNRIKQLDLIDTGRMFSITSSDIKFTMDGLDIEITTTDYYKYLDGRYNLTDYVFDLPKVSNMMTDIYGKMGNLNIINAADIRTLFNNSKIKEVGNIVATGVSSGFSVFTNCQNLYKVGNVEISSTNMNSIFQNCNNLREVGTITISSVTTQISNMFNNCVLIDTIIFGGDMSGITNTTNTFNNCKNLRKLIMPNVTTGFTIANCQLGTQELDDLFTSLGTASGSQTIIVTGNPGAATCDTSIATGKGWTVTI